MSRRKLKNLGVFALGTVAAACALAQSTSELPSVVVTAQKRAQGVNDVGMSITAISGDDFKERGMVSMGDMINSLPGMTYTESSFGVPIYTMRGVGSDDIQSAQQSPTVGVYMDQIVLPYSLLSRGANFDLERVEVLKGPQGTLYGQSTTGGLVNFIARKPTKSLEYGATVGAGSFGAGNLDAYVGGPLADGVRGRVAVMTRQGGDWQRSMSRDEKAGGKDLSALRAQLEFGRGGDFDALLAFNMWRDKSPILAAQPVALNFAFPLRPPASRLTGQRADDARDAEWTSPANRQAGNTRDYGFDQEFNSLSATMNWKLGSGITLTSLTNTARFTRDDMLSPTPFPEEGYDSDIKGKINVFSQELRLAGKTSSVQWVAGAYYSDNKIKERQLIYAADITALEAVRNVLDANQFANETDTTSTTKALFAQVEVPLSDTVNLTAGLRHNRDKQEFAGCTVDTDGSLANLLNRGNPMGPFKRGECATVLSPSPFATGRFYDNLDEKSTSARLGLDWKASKNMLVYASINRGAKAGGFSTTGASSATQLEPVVAEKLMAYETGVKWTAPDRRAQVNGAVFYYDYTDKQIRGLVSDPVFGRLGTLVNIPESKIQGLDFDAKYRATDALTLSARLAITDSKVTKYVGLGRTNNSPPVDFAGQSFPLTPREQATLSADYSFWMGAFLGSVGLDVSTQSETKGSGAFILANPNWSVPSRTLVDLRFGMRPNEGKWSIFGSIKNLTDKYYWVDARQVNDIDVRYPAKPRTFSINLSYDF